MKKLIGLTVIFCTALLFDAVGQNTELTGPAAKNYKPWKNRPSKVILAKPHKKHKGPEAKNSQPWKDNCKTEKVVFLERKPITAPKVKNRLTRRKGSPLN